MGLQQDLGFETKPANPVQKAMQAFGSTPPGAWMFSKSLHFVDKVLFRVTKGKLTVPEIMAGLPVIMVTTTGAKSGQARTMPLLAIPTGDDLALIGTNFGQKPTPGWVFNLEANPAASVTYEGVDADVTARPATPDEESTIWTTAAAIYPGYNKYKERISDRSIRVFVLEPNP